MYKFIYIIFFLTLSDLTYAYDINYEYKNVCLDKSVLAADYEGEFNYKEICESVFKGDITDKNISLLVKISNEGDMTALFLLGYYIIEYNYKNELEFKKALNMIEVSAFRANNYAHSYLYKIYSTSNYGVKNIIKANQHYMHFSVNANKRK